MPDAIFAHAADLAKDIRESRRTGPLKEMATEFIQLLESVPDCGVVTLPRSLSHG